MTAREDRNQSGEAIWALENSDSFEDSGQQLLHFGLLTSSQLVLPGIQSFGLVVDEGLQVVLLITKGHVLDVEPLLPPALNRILAEILNEPGVALDRETDAPDRVHGSFGKTPDKIEMLP